MSGTYKNFNEIEQKEIYPCSILSVGRKTTSTLECFKERPHTFLLRIVKMKQQRKYKRPYISSY